MPPEVLAQSLTDVTPSYAAREVRPALWAASIRLTRYFARTGGCRLVAEGVETEDEARALTQLGVEFGQAYWFGRPAPVLVTRRNPGVIPARRVSDRGALTPPDPG